MELIQNTPDLSAYLAADEVIDHHHPVVRQTAARLAADVPDSYAYAEAAFVYVRDEIPHSQDAQDPRVTWRASDVLHQRTGICYAKAHALAALLRAEDIPTALCYLGVHPGLVPARVLAVPGAVEADGDEAVDDVAGAVVGAQELVAEGRGDVLGAQEG
uniref:transglutaminase domain-containing protein n=1 Tax=Streptomyces niveiscabiei TaxID=164115 RepID=UPI000A7E5704